MGIHDPPPCLSDEPSPPPTLRSGLDSQSTTVKTPLAFGEADSNCSSQRESRDLGRRIDISPIHVDNCTVRTPFVIPLRSPGSTNLLVSPPALTVVHTVCTSPILRVDWPTRCIFKMALELGFRLHLHHVTTSPRPHLKRAFASRPDAKKMLLRLLLADFLCSVSKLRLHSGVADFISSGGLLPLGCVPTDIPFPMSTHSSIIKPRK